MREVQPENVRQRATHKLKRRLYTSKVSSNVCNQLIPAIDVVILLGF